MSDDLRLGDVDCERAMLATAWLAGDFLMILQLDPSDFIDPFHRWLLAHLRAMAEDDHPFDMVALQRRLAKPGAIDGLTKLEADSHKGMVAEILLAWAPPRNIDYYFRVLREERLRRATLRLVDAMRERICERHDPVAVLSYGGANIDRLLTKVPVKKETPSAEPTVVG